MSDSFEFTLNSPLSQEDWNKIMDVELDHTDKIWYKTPSGKEVAFIPLSVIEDIKAEIKGRIQRYTLARESFGMGQVDWSDYLIKSDDVIAIIDKHLHLGVEDRECHIV